jgi:hypothetical protein
MKKTPVNAFKTFRTFFDATRDSRLPSKNFKSTKDKEFEFSSLSMVGILVISILLKSKNVEK